MIILLSLSCGCKLGPLFICKLKKKNCLLLTLSAVLRITFVMEALPVFREKGVQRPFSERTLLIQDSLCALNFKTTCVAIMCYVSKGLKSNIFFKPLSLSHNNIKLLYFSCILFLFSIFFFFFFEGLDRSYRSDDTEDAVTTDNPTTPFPTPPPTLVSPRSPLPLHRQASPFPLENTNSRRIHYATPQDRLRGNNGMCYFTYTSKLLISNYVCLFLFLALFTRPYFDYRRSCLWQQQENNVEQYLRAKRTGASSWQRRHDLIEQCHVL